MSDQAGVNTSQDSSPQSAATSQQGTMVPKERLDEVLAATRRIQQENQVLAQMIRRATPQATLPQNREEEDEVTKELKESNPALYTKIKAQEAEMKRLNATNFAIIDNQDRQDYLNRFGDVGRERLEQVESQLDNLRQRGIHAYNRGQILAQMVGVDVLSKPKVPANTATPQVTAPSNSNVPSSDPVAAGVPKAGSATSGKPAETLDELEKRLEGVTF